MPKNCGVLCITRSFPCCGWVASLTLQPPTPRLWPQQHSRHSSALHLFALPLPVRVILTAVPRSDSVSTSEPQLILDGVLGGEFCSLSSHVQQMWTYLRQTTVRAWSLPLSHIVRPSPPPLHASHVCSQDSRACHGRRESVRFFGTFHSSRHSATRLQPFLSAVCTSPVCLICSLPQGSFFRRSNAAIAPSGLGGDGPVRGWQAYLTTQKAYDLQAVRSVAAPVVGPKILVPLFSAKNREPLARNL